MPKFKTKEQKEEALKGIRSPLERKVLSAELVRLTTISGTTLIGPVSEIDRYHVLIGNIVIFKNAIEMLEIDPNLDDEEDED